MNEESASDYNQDKNVSLCHYSRQDTTELKQKLTANTLIYP
jgi:hypothetical protein